MNRSARTIFTWVCFIAALVILGWHGDIFESRAANVAYQTGTILGGTLLVLLAIAAANTIMPKRWRVTPWLIYGVLFAGFIYAKVELDNYLRPYMAASAQTIAGSR